MKMPWGKFKGKPIEDVESSYLEWALRESNLADQYPEIAEEVQNQLDAREGKGIDRTKRQ